MDKLYIGLTIVLVFVAIAIIALVLLQKGKGADAGAAFGSGASGTVFGARGSTNFLSRATAIMAVAFFATCLGLAYLSTQRSTPDSLLDSLGAGETAPAESGLIPADTDGLAGDAVGIEIPAEAQNLPDDLEIPEESDLETPEIEVPEAGADEPTP